VRRAPEHEPDCDPDVQMRALVYVVEKGLNFVQGERRPGFDLDVLLLDPEGHFCEVVHPGNVPNCVTTPAVVSPKWFGQG